MARLGRSFPIRPHTTRFRLVTAVAYSLTADTASFALSGTSTGLRAGRKLVAAQATFTLTGSATGLRYGRRLVCAQATFALTGYDTGLRRAARIAASAGTSTLTGNATGVLAQRRITAAQATFTLTGVAVTLNRGKTLTAATATFTITGNATGLRRAARLNAATQTFTITGDAAQLRRQYTLLALSSSMALTGIAVTLRYARAYRITVDAGSFVLSAAGVSFTLSQPSPLWINELYPGGSWQAGQDGIPAGSEMFDGLEVYAGQLGLVSEWSAEARPADDDEGDPLWTNDAVPGGSWQAGQASLWAGAEYFGDLELLAGQLGEASVWDTETITTEGSSWTYDIYPGAAWRAGQPSLLAGSILFDGLEVYAGALGAASVWVNDEVE